MAAPTAALHGATKLEVSNGTTNTLASDSGTVAVGDWLVCLIGGLFGVGDPVITYTLAKTAGTSTVGASVTPISPLGAVAKATGSDTPYTFQVQAIYLPVTGAGTLTATATRTAGSLDHAMCCHFVRVQNPGAIGAVGFTADNVSSTNITVTLDNACGANSTTLMAVFSNNGNGLITEPTGTTELADTDIAAAGCQMESAKDEGSPATSPQFTNLANVGTHGRCAIAFEIQEKMVFTAARPLIVAQSVGRSNFR